MGFLKAIIDQTFGARRIARQLCQDDGFVERIGLNALPTSQRIKQLHPRAGFVLSFYGSAEACFKAYPELPADERLLLVFKRQLHGLSHIPDAHKHAVTVMTKFQSSQFWNALDISSRFETVCAQALAEVEMNLRGIPAEEALKSDVINEIVEGVFQYKEFELQ